MRMARRAPALATLLLALALLLSAAGLAESAGGWREGLSAAKPYEGVPEVDLSERMGYMMFGPVNGKSIENSCLGKRFGALVVWNCRCDCSGETVVSRTNLCNEHTKSCGHLQRAVSRKNLKFVDGTSVVMIENCMKRPIKSNTSGVNGVYYRRRTNAWCAQITFKGTTYFLGKYDGIQDAIRARKTGEKVFERFLDGIIIAADARREQSGRI